MECRRRFEEWLRIQGPYGAPQLEATEGPEQPEQEQQEEPTLQAPTRRLRAKTTPVEAPRAQEDVDMDEETRKRSAETAAEELRDQLRESLNTEAMVNDPEEEGSSG